MPTEGTVLCVLCHSLDAVYAHSTMVDDSLQCYYDVYHAGLRPKDFTIRLHEIRTLYITTQTNRFTLHPTW